MKSNPHLEWSIYLAMAEAASSVSDHQVDDGGNNGRSAVTVNKRKPYGQKKRKVWWLLHAIYCLSERVELRQYPCAHIYTLLTV